MRETIIEVKNSTERLYVIENLCEYLRASEIEELFGIPFSTYNLYIKKNNLERYGSAHSKRRNQMFEEFIEQEEEEKVERIDLVIEELKYRRSYAEASTSSINQTST